MTNEDLVAALVRADRLITWMAGYIGKMAPGDYPNCYIDLNEHWVFMDKARDEGVVPDQRLEL